VDGWVPVGDQDVLVERTPALCTVGFGRPSVVHGWVPDSARDVLVERIPAFWTSGSARWVSLGAQDAWLNRPQYSSWLFSGRFPRRLG
jgi:hypothetical protein